MQNPELSFIDFFFLPNKITIPIDGNAVYITFEAKRGQGEIEFNFHNSQSVVSSPSSNSVKLKYKDSFQVYGTCIDLSNDATKIYNALELNFREKPTADTTMNMYLAAFDECPYELSLPYQFDMTNWNKHYPYDSDNEDICANYDETNGCNFDIPSGNEYIWGYKSQPLFLDYEEISINLAIKGKGTLNFFL